MPFDPGSLSLIYQATFLANGFMGPNLLQLTTGLANGLSVYVNSGLIVQSADVGTLGAGVGTGFGVVLSPAVLFGTLSTTFTAHGILGPMALSQANAISLGTSQIFALSIISTISAGVGVGAGVARLIPNPLASFAAFQQGFLAAGMIGPMGVNLAAAIAEGIDFALPTAVGAVVIAGPPNIVPGAGVGIGRLS